MADLTGLEERVVATWLTTYVEGLRRRVLDVVDGTGGMEPWVQVALLKYLMELVSADLHVAQQGGLFDGAYANVPGDAGDYC